ncbi:pentapeptide repeat-containing protein [Dickeya dadantii]|uniref:pentapeptide repeat-containing protein n=1 Tax=Dickeya dadantii TaxID=204038 RepID=UPI002031543F|nr:pentapeptide repeat-containing protein [Dickeya dadantii]MCL6407593.1 pentapeptide repeat-containing protein [Dickeya dadantii]
MARPDSSKMDFRNKSQHKANFRKHKLYMSRFEFSNFPDSDFSAVSAKQCCFIRANLQGSDFTGANLHGANFGGADLRNANFKSAILHHVNFENALTEGANFVGASIKMCRKLNLSDAQRDAIEQAKDKLKAVAKADLDKRKNSPDYQTKLLERILKKPWIDTIDDRRDVGGSIIVTLKSGYTFLDPIDSTQKNFDSFQDAQENTRKSSINSQNDLAAE